MNIYIIIYLLFTHTVADFLLQSKWMATNKSKNINALFTHVAVYTVVFQILFIFPHYLYYGGERLLMTFPFITFTCHFITDYFSSKITSRQFANKQYYTKLPNFGVFSVIQIDQMAHYIQLIFTYWYLFIKF